MIRTATVADHEAILKVAKQSKYTRDFSNRVMFSSDAAYEKGWIQVFELDGEIVGFTCVREKIRQPEVVLYFITVDKNHGGKGIGHRLINNIRSRTKHRRLVLNVAKDNQEARAFYAALGFTETGESLGGSGLALKREW